MNPPKLIFFNNFDYPNFDRAASFEIFDYTSQTAIMLVDDKYVLCKFYYELLEDYSDKGNMKTKETISSLKGNLFCFYVDSKYTGGTQNSLKDHIKCYTTADISSMNMPAFYSVKFQKFPLGFKLTGTYDPDKTNSNVLLVTNLIMYEYLVFALFGSRKTKSPYSGLKIDEDWDKVKVNIPSKNSEIEKDVFRGYYFYKKLYRGLDDITVQTLRLLEIDFGYEFGLDYSFDVPFTTNKKSLDIEGDLKFVGTDKLGITEELFKFAYKIWLNDLSKKSYTNLDAITSISYRVDKSESYSLSYSDDNILESYDDGKPDRKAFLASVFTRENAKNLKFNNGKTLFKQSCKSKKRSVTKKKDVQFNETEIHSIFSDIIK